MKIATSISIALLLSLVASAGAAPKQEKAPQASTIPENCESVGESIKRCFVEGDVAELHLNISRAYPLLVSFEEQPEFAIGDDYVKANATDNHILFSMKQDRLPKGHKILVRTQTMTLTISFNAVSSGADSQVQVLRGDNAKRDRAVDQRVEVIRKEMESDYKGKLNNLDARAATIARKKLLQEVYDGGSQISNPSGEVRARQDFLVFRANKLIRMGSERLLLVSIEERKGDTFAIGNFTASVTQAGAKREVDADFRCGSMRVRPGQVVSCYLSLGSIKRRGRMTADILLEGADGDRSVRLSGVGIR